MARFYEHEGNIIDGVTAATVAVPLPLFEKIVCDALNYCVRQDALVEALEAANAERSGGDAYTILSAAVAEFLDG